MEKTAYGLGTWFQPYQSWLNRLKNLASIGSEESSVLPPQCSHSGAANGVAYRPSESLDLARRQIRILRLHPSTGKGEDPVTCSLYTAYLDENNAKTPKYEALSYVWGDPQVCRIVIVDSVPVYVTVNLEAALRRLRSPRGGHVRHLWVDALCINQADDREKTHQVRIMSDIYTRTAHAVLWLGEFSTEPRRPAFLRAAEQLDPDRAAQEQDAAGAGTGAGALNMGLSPTPAPPAPDPNAAMSEADAVAAFTVLRALAAGGSSEHVVSPAAAAAARSGASVAGSHNAHVRSARNGKALQALMGLPWWERAWTVQEAILPPHATLQVGAETIPIDHLIRAVENVVGHYLRGCCNARLLGGRFYSLVISLQMHRGMRLSIEAFIMALDTFRFRTVSDPRDKVFSLLGLAGAGGTGDEKTGGDDGGREAAAAVSGLLAAVDYSLPVETVFLRTVRQLVVATSGLRPLLRSVQPDRIVSLPSWVPDFTANLDASPRADVTSWQAVFLKYSAAVARPLTIRPPAASSGEAEERILALSGFRMDRVAQIGDVLRWDYRQDRRVIDQWQEIVDNIEQAAENRAYPAGGNAGGTYQDAFWRVMVADMVLDVNEQTGKPFTRRARATDEATSRARWAPAERVGILPIEIHSINRRLFVTEGGLLGLGDKDLVVGDEVYILLGGNMPLVLRPYEGEKEGDQAAKEGDCSEGEGDDGDALTEHCTYVGEAYVHGIMDGEALNLGRQAHWVALH